MPSVALPGNSDLDTDTSPTHNFLAIILGLEQAGEARQNPQNTNYAEGLKPAKRMSGGQYPWSNGLFFVTDTGPYGLVDYQGKPYRVRLDTSNDREIANPNPLEISEGRSRLPKGVIVWGAGKDGNWETWDDNPKSWD